MSARIGVLPPNLAGVRQHNRASFDLFLIANRAAASSPTLNKNVVTMLYQPGHNAWHQTHKGVVIFNFLRYANDHFAASLPIRIVP